MEPTISVLVDTTEKIISPLIEEAIKSGGVRRSRWAACQISSMVKVFVDHWCGLCGAARRVGARPQWWSRYRDTAVWVQMMRRAEVQTTRWGASTKNESDICSLRSFRTTRSAGRSCQFKVCLCLDTSIHSKMSKLAIIKNKLSKLLNNTNNDKAQLFNQAYEVHHGMLSRHVNLFFVNNKLERI